MESFFFGNTDRMLYGVFHAASQEHYRNRSVLLLYPVGHEYMHIHRAYRRLADSLSDLGFDVLRFDYACTGDSFGEFEEASIDQWIDSAVIAYDELQTAVAVVEIQVMYVVNWDKRVTCHKNSDQEIAIFIGHKPFLVPPQPLQ